MSTGLTLTPAADHGWRVSGREAGPPPSASPRAPGSAESLVVRNADNVSAPAGGLFVDRALIRLLDWRYGCSVSASPNLILKRDGAVFGAGSARASSRPWGRRHAVCLRPCRGSSRTWAWIKPYKGALSASSTRPRRHLPSIRRPLCASPGRSGTLTTSTGDDGRPVGEQTDGAVHRRRGRAGRVDRAQSRNSARSRRVVKTRPTRDHHEEVDHVHEHRRSDHARREPAHQLDAVPERQRLDEPLHRLGVDVIG